MAKAVDFNKDLISQLSTEAEGELDPDRRYEFPEWDILKELDRRERRKVRNRDKEVREWMKKNPDEVEKLRRKHL